MSDHPFDNDGMVVFDHWVPTMKTPVELNKIADVVLAYRPKPKTKAAKRRKRRAQNAKRKRR